MTITIVGIGLIGGSMALSLRDYGFANHIIGVSRRPETAQKALELGLVDEILPLEEAIKKADIVIVATPVDLYVTILPTILDLIDNQIVIEVGSTKKIVIDAIRNHPKRANFVATHPMAGTEYSGPEAAIHDLFKNKLCVLCDAEDSKPEFVTKIEEMYQSIGMRIAFMNSTDHDRHTAYISHISHICSFALALTVLEKEKDEEAIFNLASTGFESTVRLAKSNPDTWVPIFRQNRDNVLSVLDEYINNLLKFKGLMLADSYEKLHEFFEEANKIKKILK
ncbi:MAG: prephenate dehydrogenase [Bacteroidota bacterium]